MNIIKTIRAEIGKHLDSLNKVKHLATFAEEHGYNHGFEDAMRDLLSFLDTLEGHSEIPNNHLEVLDEAALVYQLSIPTEYPPFMDGEGCEHPMFDLTAIEDAFKAGAEWDRSQGETNDEVVFEANPGNTSCPMVLSSVDTFKVGDKVIVQIRKK